MRCCRRRASSSAASPPRSTPPCSRSWSAMSSGCGSELEERGYARDFLIMNGNGGMISARFVTRESAKTVMSGPASGVIAAAYTGKRAGFRQPRHLRHGRHLDRRGADPQCRARGLQRDRDRICDADPCADGGGAYGRRRRRLDRARRCLRPDPGRPGKRRRQSRPDLLRPRRHRADHHRRQSAARPARPEEAARGRSARSPSSMCGRSSRRGSATPPASTALRRRARCCGSAT